MFSICVLVHLIPLVCSLSNISTLFPHSSAPPVGAEKNLLAQALLTQITTQLQALAALSPQTLQQIQSQLIAASMTPNPWSQVSGVAGTNNNTTASSLLANFQLAAQQQPQQQAPMAAQPTADPSPAALSALQGLLSQQSQVAAENANQFAHLYGLAAQNMAPPSHSSSSATVSNQQRVSPQQVHAQVQLQARQSPPQQQHQAIVNPVLQNKSKASSPSMSQCSSQSSGSRPTSGGAAVHGQQNMHEMLDALRRGHAEALEKVKREEAERRRSNEGSQSSGGKAKRKRSKPSTLPTSNNSSNEGKTTTITKTTSRTSSSHNDSSEGGLAANKQKQTAFNGVSFLPFEHATTTSSGSGCTTNPFDTEESSSSAENVASDEVNPNGSTSSNSSSDDDKEGRNQHQNSVPLRKRFKTKTSPTNGGITSRNLADHNIRMNEMDARGSEK